MKKEKGAATLVEHAIVLPLVFALVIMLIFIGFSMHQRAVMEAATHRAAIYISRTVVDPSYENIVTTDGSQDANDILSAQITKESIVNAPYRYLFSGSGTLPDSELSTAELIKKNQIFTDKDPVVKVEKKAGIFTKVTVTATQDFDFPTILNGLNLPSILTIESQSVVYINQPAEFIRNADYVMDLVMEAVGPLIEKVSNVISKIKFFNTNVK